jgi:hypothetical protein
MFPKGVDPREHLPNHSERGPRRFVYTTHDVASLIGVSKRTLRRWGLDVGSLEAVCLAWVQRRLRVIVKAQSTRLSDEEVVVVLGKGKLPLWDAAWPRFELHWCGLCGKEVLLSPGLCNACGGGRPAAVLDSRGYIALYVGRRYVPLHRIILPAPGLDVHHGDENKWNNRPDNLEAKPHVEHWEEHKYRSTP